MSLCCASFLTIYRRSFAGAWIEITTDLTAAKVLFVAPSQGRGLKSTTTDQALYLTSRSFAGAWIEIAHV